MIRLGLFFSRDTSLQTWVDAGILNREVALYAALAAHRVRTAFFTYGNRQANRARHQLPAIAVHYNYLNLPPKRYERYLHRLHALPLSRCDLLKTNQMNSAAFAYRAARVWRKPLIARLGYHWSEFLEQSIGADDPYTQWARRVEADVLPNAQAVIVTTEAMQEKILSDFPSVAPRMHVIPNYVDTAVFRPESGIAKAVDLLFIGRIAPQKNLPLLLDTLRKHPSWTLRIIGDGEDMARLRQEYTDLAARVTWFGRLDHATLPRHIHEARVCVLPSLYEGHPKSLIEAMMAGAAVVGTRVNGIKNQIRHGQTGLLADPDPIALGQAIQQLLDNTALREQLGRQAHHYALEHFSLISIAAHEAAVYTRVIGENR